ncbi:hypothetical protein [Aeromonas hydrophila]|uniref:hypothetical protein n=1 Tax=Aeromonas hydrophila TaxID=644 RepID=UPI001377228D|nr:hypothetical protein [Aeromonas hydrophila]
MDEITTNDYILKKIKRKNSMLTPMDFAAMKHYLKYYKLRTFISLLLTSFLIGCGGNEEGNNSYSLIPPSPVDSITVVDGFGAVRPDTATRVDLAAFVRGQNATLTTLTSEQTGCNATGLSGLTAEVLVDGTGLCQYTYIASNGNSTATASLNVLASSKASPVLSPLSQAMTLGSGSVNYDIQALLGSEWPSGYSLDVTSLIVQGGSEQGSVIGSGNTITYTPPTTPDWNRVVFILKNPSRPDEDALGTLYITVSDAINQAPVIGTPKYDYKAQTGATIVTFENSTLDLGTLTNLNISDPEGEVWQLIEVQSYSATVAPVDPTSVTNKQFTFTAGTIGSHIVSYIVGDHQGGFAMGVMNINVGPRENPKSWSDLTIDDITFYATPLYSEAFERGVIAEGIWDSRVKNTIAGMTGSQASAFCNGSRLANQSNMDKLRLYTPLSSELVAYPKDRDYIISNTGGLSYLKYNLLDGSTETYIPGVTDNQYVICIKYATDGNMSYTPIANAVMDGYTNTVISDGTTWWPIGVVTSDDEISTLTLTESTNAGSNPVPLNERNFRLNPTRCSGGCLLEAFGSIDVYGIASINLESAVDNTKKLDIGPVTFWQNAKLTGLRSYLNNRPADGVSKNSIWVTLQDKDGNSLEQWSQVRLTYSTSPSANVTIDPPLQDGGTTFTVNRQGEIMLSLTYLEESGGSVELTVNPVVSGLPGTNHSIGIDFTATSP